MKKGIKKVSGEKAEKAESYLIPDRLRENVYLKFLALLNEKEYLEKNSDLATALEHGIIKSIDEHFRETGISEIYQGTRILLDGLDPYDHDEYLENNSDIEKIIKKEKLLSAFEHYLLYGYHEILRGERPIVFVPAESEYLIPNVLRTKVYRHFIEDLDKVEYLKKNSDLLLAIENGSIENIDVHFIKTGIKEIYEGTRILMEGLEPYSETLYRSLNQDI